MKSSIWSILFYGLILCWKNTDEFIVKSSSSFPISVNKIFKLKVMRLNKNENLSNFTGDTMVIKISDKSGSIQEKVIFNYGLFDTIDNEFHGEYFSVKKLAINSNSSEIDISMVFKKNSNLLFLEIFLISTSSKQIYKNLLRNLNLSKRIYRNMISLLSPSIINLSLVSNDGNGENWRIGDIVTATCRTYDGIPVEIPIFENYENLSVLDSTFSRQNNERKIKFKIQLTDHLTRIKCYSGNSYKYFVIKVLHHPTQIYFQPNISTTMKLNTKVLCFVKDGYPSPNIEWIYLEGPINSSQFFQINTNRSEILINKNCPIKSKWKFECRATYDFGTTHKRIEKIISFVVIDPKPNNANIDYDEFNNRLKNLEIQIQNINDNYNKEKLDLVKVQRNLQNEIKKMEKKCKCFYENVDESKRNQTMTSEIVQINLIIKNLNKTNHLQFDLFKNTQNFQFNLINGSIGNLKSEIDGLKQNNKHEISELKNKLEQVESKMKNANLKMESNNTKCKILPFIGEIKSNGQNSEINEWIINDFQNLKDRNEELLSPLFYGFTNGYQMRLNIIPKGQTSGANIFMSLFFQIVPGEYDNELLWPMKSKIKLSIKNQITGRLHFTSNYSLKINSKYYFVFNKPQCNGSDFLGIPSYAPLGFLEKNEFMRKDVVVIVCEVVKNMG